MLDRKRGPSAARAEPGDFDQLVTICEPWRGRIEQLSSGRFAGCSSAYHGRRSRVVSFEGNQRLRFQGGNALGCAAIVPITSGLGSSSWAGSQIHVGDVVAVRRQGEFDLYTGRTFSGSIFFIDPGVLEIGSGLSCLGSDWPADQGSSVFQPDQAAFTRLIALIARLLEGESVLGAPCRESRFADLEDDCIRAVLDCVRTPRLSHASTPDAHSELLRRAESLMRSRLSEPLSTTIVCRELQVCDRTLRYAFRRRYGVGPMTFHRFIRLSAVRALLRGPQPTSVAEAARRFGFTHLGNFAADYRRHFGYRPRDTNRL